MRGLVLRVLVAATSVGMIVANVLANVLPFFGRNTGEVSALYPTLITPAGYVFAIWGLIYIGLIALSVGQFLEPLRHDPLPERIALPVIVSNFANVGWLLLWHALKIVWTVPVMLVLLGSLIAAYVLARRGRPDKPGIVERWCVRAPLGLYLGWVSVATIANISGALVGVRWDGFGISPVVWSIVVLVVACALALVGLWRESDGVFAWVFVWAFGGIKVASASPVVGWVALVFAVVIGISTIAVATSRQRAV